MSLVILTGASGAGKTTIAREIERRAPNVPCFFFDSIGVPSLDEMVAQYGSGEAWQRAMTIEWIKRLRDHTGSVLFEGQMRIAFLLEALALTGVQAQILLVDCNDAIRTARLNHERQQPELANEQMMSWAAYLRREAQEAKLTILDTSEATLETSTEAVRKFLAV